MAPVEPSTASTRSLKHQQTFRAPQMGFSFIEVVIPAIHFVWNRVYVVGVGQRVDVLQNSPVPACRVDRQIRIGGDESAFRVGEKVAVAIVSVSRIVQSPRQLEQTPPLEPRSVSGFAIP